MTDKEAFNEQKKTKESLSDTFSTAACVAVVAVLVAMAAYAVYDFATDDFAVADQASADNIAASGILEKPGVDYGSYIGTSATVVGPFKVVQGFTIEGQWVDCSVTTEGYRAGPFVTENSYTVSPGCGL